MGRLQENKSNAMEFHVAVFLFVSFYQEISCETHFSEIVCRNMVEELKTFRKEVTETTNLFATNQGKTLDKLNKLLSQGSSEVGVKDEVKDDLKGEVSSLKKMVHAMQTEMKKMSGRMTNSGAVYVRWGRHDCPNNETEEIYKGFAGGSWSSHTGGSVNYVCLPFDPIWDKYNDVINNDNQNMHGAEYMGNSINIPGTPFDKGIRGHNVPCVVCRSTARNSVLRIPGRNQCYSGWHLEYAGYLMAGKYTDAAASEYACVDRDAQPLRGGFLAKGGKFFYPVEGHCHYSLKCPPYVHGRELTCAVCTK